MLYTGINKLPDNFWDVKSEALTSWQEDMRTLYEIKDPPLDECYPYQSLYTEEGASFEALVKSIGKEKTTLIHAIIIEKIKNQFGVLMRKIANKILP